MPNQVFFQPNGSSRDFPVNSREEILDILREKHPALAAIDIVLKDGVYIVVTRIKDDVSWIGVGRTTGPI